MAGMEIRLLAAADTALLDRVAPDVFDEPLQPALVAEFLADDRHHMVVALDDGLVCEGQPVLRDHLYYFEPGRTELGLQGTSSAPARALLLGGTPFAETIVMWWNFVGRTTEEVVAARTDWQAGRRENK